MTLSSTMQRTKPYRGRDIDLYLAERQAQPARGRGVEWRKEGGLVSDVVESCYLNVRIWKFGLPIVVYSRRRRVGGEEVRGIEKKTERQRRRRKTAAFGKHNGKAKKRRGKEEEEDRQ
ncbi:hypothetical protein HC256_005241 [Beauveria bassiana]|nr:hypothetical protein HC256_005241 [Beauveria bassiana]